MMMMHDHASLVRQAARWLRRKRCTVIITEMTSAARETPDAIGWPGSGRPILVECKASRADFMRDRKKFVRREPEWGMGSLRYYLAPEGLIASGELPDAWGLIEVDASGRLREVVKAAVQQRNTADEVTLLISALRRVGQDAPDGVSVKCYTYETKNTASLGVAVFDSPLPFPEPDPMPKQAVLFAEVTA